MNLFGRRETLRNQTKTADTRIMTLLRVEKWLKGGDERLGCGSENDFVAKLLLVWWKWHIGLTLQ